MRIWDIPCKKLCNNHLLGEHRELHCVFSFISNGIGGSYQKHPETLRWVGKLAALSKRHDEQVKEMAGRGWCHKSDLPTIHDYDIQDVKLISVVDQRSLLKSKKCQCDIS